MRVVSVSELRERSARYSADICPLHLPCQMNARFMRVREEEDVLVSDAFKQREPGRVSEGAWKLDQTDALF